MSQKGAKRVDPALLAQAGITMALSFDHIHTVAVLVGQSGWKGWCYPPSVDLLMASGYRRILHARVRGASTRTGMVAFFCGIAASLAANVIALQKGAELAALAANPMLHVIVGAWPAIALVVSTLLWHSPAEAPVQAQDEQDQEQDQAAPGAPERGGEHDTPEAVTEAPDDTPEPELPAPDSMDFIPAVMAHVSAGRMADAFPSRAAFHRAVNHFLVTHDYPTISVMKVHRFLDKKA